MREQGIRPIRGRFSGTIVCGVLLMIALSMRVVWLLTVGTIVGEAMSSLADASLSWAMNTSATIWCLHLLLIRHVRRREWHIGRHAVLKLSITERMA
jgi:hypothetical protein